MTEQINIDKLHKEIVTLTESWFETKLLKQRTVYEKIEKASEAFPEIHKLLEFFKQFKNPLQYFSISILNKDLQKNIHLFTIRAHHYQHARCMIKQLLDILEKNKESTLVIEHGLVSLNPQINWKTPKIERIF